MIKFKKIRWKNFLSTGNIFTEIDLNDAQTTLIIGDNGAGKSTILDALTFCLFGKAFRKINKPQLLNSITKKGLHTEVEFDIGRNQYKIIRGMNPNIFEVFKNGKRLNQDAKNKDYQSTLEKQILKVNYKSFCQVVVLGSATFQPFMQLPAGQRREIIEDLLDLQIFTIMNTLLKSKTDAINEKLSELSTEKRIIESKIETIKEHQAEIKQNTKKFIEEKKSRIQDSIKELESIDKNIKQYIKQIEELSLEVSEEDTLKKKLSELQKYQHKINAKLNHVSTEIDFFENHDNCPTCQQEIELEFKISVTEKRKEETKKYEEGLDKISLEYDKIKKSIDDIMEINSKIYDLKIELNTFKNKKTHLQDYIEDLNQQIKEAKEKKEDEQGKLPALKSDLETILRNHTEYTEKKNVLSVSSTLLKDTGIKSRIIKQYIPVMNKLINKYLASMEFMCHFELDEQFNEVIKSRYRDEFSYSSFSEGEKMRINLAILFAWRAIAKMRNSINTNILIMDEVFDSSLDSNGTDEFLKIIKSLTSDTNTFIISHKSDQLIDKFEKVVRFEKHKNFSRMVS